MRAFLALLAVAAIASGPVLAAPLAVYPTKDAGMPGHSAENNSNAGADNSDRMAKDYQHTGAYDFDINPTTNTAVADWLVSMGVNPTVSDMVNAINADVIGVQFRVAMDYGLAGIAPRVRTIDCAVDWAEGDGASWTNENWSPLTTAATWTNPNQVLTADGGPLGLGWGLSQNTGFTNASYTENSKRLNWLAGAVGGDYANAALDAEIVRQLAEEVNNRGLYTFSSWGDGAVNGKAFFREQGGTAMDPNLLFVPEPISLMLLGLGGLGVLIRRRRR